MDNPGLWSFEDAYHHLKVTFQEVCDSHGELLEQYVVMLVDAGSKDEEIRIMRQGLRSTIAARYPFILKDDPAPRRRP